MGSYPQYCFTLYLNCYSLNLLVSKFGCKFVNNTVHHLMYADDLTLLALSAKDLEEAD